jgi:hypothetical protein
MMRPTKRPLELAPEAVNRVGMGFASDELVSSMLDRPVRVAEGFKGIVTVALIRGNLRTDRNGLLNQRHKSGGANLFNDIQLDLSLPLDSPEYGGLASRTTTALAGSNTANVGFVNLDVPADGPDVFLHQKADLFGDAPRTFVGNSKLTLKFFGRNTVLGNAHQKDSVEPQSQRSGRLVEDRTSRGRNLMPAPRARVTAALKNRVETILVLAAGALNTVWVLFVEQKRQTRGVIRELFSEVLNCVFHVFTLSEGIPVVKV